MGPIPEQVQYRPWITQIASIRCPSDPGTGLPSLGRTNYAMCIGDSVSGWNILGNRSWNLFHQTTIAGEWITARTVNRGVFLPQQRSELRDILDGTANTIMFGEIATDLGDKDVRTRAVVDSVNTVVVRDNPRYCRSKIDQQRPRFWLESINEGGGAGQMFPASEGRGFHWASSYLHHTAFHTILPPNSEICASGSAANGMNVSASSQHQGGVHVCMADGAIKFVTDSIDSGNTAVGFNPLVNDMGSPYGIWGNMGTRAQGEVFTFDF